MNGFDPYSNSKSCSELVTDSYKNSFFSNRDIAISTMRAGNVIGGGDFAKDRIIPDCVRAAVKGEGIIIRNPHSVRPYQHVLDPVMAYLIVAQEQYRNPSLAGNYNVGPDESNCLTTGDIASLFCSKWNEKSNCNIQWINKWDGGPHEADYLKLDCSRMKKVFHWAPLISADKMLEMTVDWYWALKEQSNINRKTDDQVSLYIKK